MTDDARRLTALQEKVDQLEQALVEQRNVNAAAQMATLLSLTAVSQTLRHSYGIQQEMLTGLGLFWSSQSGHIFKPQLPIQSPSASGSPGWSGAGSCCTPSRC
ncbi:hypothetical protein KUW00_09645, partial [Halomonas sp. DP5N14-9]|uniref:hypothetical protein n=1 Tax=Halomonas sp. DP5N14-9 TaxID=2859075 RepID=UPI001C99FCF5